jgi:hypothetical protein
MPANPGDRADSRRGLHPSAEAGSAVRGPSQNRRFGASARASAARLMAPGGGLDIPRLTSASLDPFQPLTAYAGVFELARNLLLAGVGAPQDWAECHADPVNFVLRTVKRSAAEFDHQVIDAVAHTNITLGTRPSPSSWREPEPNPNRLFLAVEATHISIVYLRQSFDLLAKADPRLPATFYEMLREALSPWILCYDESAAGYYFDYRMENYEEEKAAGEDEAHLEKPQTIAEAKGPRLADEFQPWPDSELPTVITSIRKGSKVRRIMQATADLLALSRKRKDARLEWSVLQECFPDGFYTIPFTILAFHSGDVVCQAFESDEQDWLNGGEEPSPAFFNLIDPHELNSIRVAFENLRHFLSMLEAFGKLLRLLPGADLLEVEN